MIKANYFLRFFLWIYHTIKRTCSLTASVTGMKPLTHHLHIRFPDPTLVPACFPFSLFQIKPVGLMSYMKHLSEKKTRHNKAR